jgi:hypothetical protein
MTYSVNCRQATESAYEVMRQMPRRQSSSVQGLVCSGDYHNRYPDMYLDEERLKLPNNTAHRTLLANLLWCSKRQTAEWGETASFHPRVPGFNDF